MVALKGKAATKMRMQWETYNWRTIQKACKSQKPVSGMRPVQQRRNEVIWRPGQEATSAPPCWNLRSFGNKCTALKKALVILLRFSALPQWLLSRGIVPLSPLVTSLQCSLWFRSRSAWYQGRNEVRWRPGQEPNLAPPHLNLRSYGSKFTVLKAVFVTLLEIFSAPRSHSAPPYWFRCPRNCSPLHPLVTPLNGIIVFAT